MKTYGDLRKEQKFAYENLIKPIPIYRSDRRFTNEALNTIPECKHYNDKIRRNSTVDVANDIFDVLLSGPSKDQKKVSDDIDGGKWIRFSDIYKQIIKKREDRSEAPPFASTIQLQLKYMVESKIVKRKEILPKSKSSPNRTKTNVYYKLNLELYRVMAHSYFMMHLIEQSDAKTLKYLLMGLYRHLHFNGMLVPFLDMYNNIDNIFRLPENVRKTVAIRRKELDEELKNDGDAELASQKEINQYLEMKAFYNLKGIIDYIINQFEVDNDELSQEESPP